MYKKAYYNLFNAITDALNSGTREEMTNILKQAQIEAEEIIVSDSEEI